MELFDVSFGDSYERRSVGLALSLESARELARSFIAGEEDHDRAAFESGSYWFSVIRREVGVVSDQWVVVADPLGV